MKYLIILITFLSVTLSARAEDFNVLWEMDLSPFANHVHVSDDGKYFFYSDSGYVKFHDSETGNKINQIEEREFLLLGWQDYYLNNDRVVLPYSLDSILIYNIATNMTEAIINLNYNVEDANIRWVSLSPNKRFMTILCYFNEERHIIVVDLEEKRLYKDTKLLAFVEQLFSTNDPNKMIVVTSEAERDILMEITIDGSQPFGYKRNIFEEVDKDGEIRGQKYDANENAFYYLNLPYGEGHKLIKYSFQTLNTKTLHEQELISNKKIWFNNNNGIILYEVGVLHNLITDEYLRLRVFVDNIQQIASSCEGLETILIREYTSLQNHKLRRLDVSDFLTSIETENPDNNILYPNPTNSFVNINLNCTEPTINYQINNTQGLLIFQNIVPNQSSNFQIDFSQYPVGVYFLTINCNAPKTYKIVKEG